MSSTLYWEPVLRAPKERTLSSNVKLMLRELYGFPVALDLGEEHIPALRALAINRPADIAGELIDLIDAIEKHGGVRLREGNW